jgi:hypothetical protein
MSEEIKTIEVGFVGKAMYKKSAIDAVKHRNMFNAHLFDEEQVRQYELREAYREELKNIIQNNYERTN